MPTKKEIDDIRSNFINLIGQFSDLIRRFNEGDFNITSSSSSSSSSSSQIDEKSFYEELNNLKKEINNAELFNPKGERNINFFNDVNNRGYFSYDLMQVLINFSKIPDVLLDSPQFYNEAHTIFEKIIYALAFDTENIGDFAELIAKVLNRMTREKYFLVICDHLEGREEFKVYNCGRAMMQNSGSLLPETRFIIFNTNADEQPDRDIIEKYGEQLESDASYSLVVLNNENDSIENREIFKTEVLKFKTEPGVDKKKVLDIFFGRVFQKVFYDRPAQAGINLDFVLLIPILDLNYDIIFEITLQRGDEAPVHYKFYTIINPKESQYAPLVLTQVQYLEDGSVVKNYRDLGIQIILGSLEKLI